MIPQIYITQWKKNVPWSSDYQVEQDLIIERALIELFSDTELREQLAFRGGTALHKLYLKPQARYSEDIDLVQIKEGPAGDLLTLLREKLTFLGNAKYKTTGHNATLTYRFESEAEPVVNLKLKIEINTREHFTVYGYENLDHSLKSEWFKGDCHITTFSLEELLGTKLRALYQRKKGRDLFDIYYSMIRSKIDAVKVINGFKEYISADSLSISRMEYIENMEAKIKDSDFLGDITALLRPNIEYDHESAWDLVKSELINKLI